MRVLHNPQPSAVFTGGTPPKVDWLLIVVVESTGRARRSWSAGLLHTHAYTYIYILVVFRAPTFDEMDVSYRKPALISFLAQIYHHGLDSFHHFS